MPARVSLLVCLQLFQIWLTCEKSNTQTAEHDGTSNFSSCSAGCNLVYQHYLVLHFVGFMSFILSVFRSMDSTLSKILKARANGRNNVGPN